ncbi:hypothetical protein BD770DRAFT_460048 [Pilaira anomala]|nr:hypothetical protein BD770DRAFT_460048 [Pilaira anomala]
MKLINLKYWTSILVILYAMSGVCTAAPAGSVLFEDVPNELDLCVENIKAYRLSLISFLYSMTIDDWNITKDKFETCRSKCHRCSLRNAVYSMNYMDTLSGDFQSNLAILRMQQHTILPDLSDCKFHWASNDI